VNWVSVNWVSGNCPVGEPAVGELDVGELAVGEPTRTQNSLVVVSDSLESFPVSLVDTNSMI
jgi:hypothetical protein